VRLADERSRRVVFLSHCLLNENVRYPGGAFRAGAIPEVVRRFVDDGVGLHQMPCPERRAWGGVLRRHAWPLVGTTGTWRNGARRVAQPLFLAWTRLVYRRIAREVAREIADYLRSGFEVVGIVGVGASPSCGACTTLDLGRSIDALAGCPRAQLDREFVNRHAVAAAVVPGEGMYLRALRRELDRRGVRVAFYEHDLLAEMQGRPSDLVEVRP
jgi:predicted secreted protein